METILISVGWAYVCFIFYLAYVALWAAKVNGKLAATPLLVRGVAWSVIVVALVLDVAFNIVVGSVLFLEPPSLRRLTFTKRCQRWKDDAGWRGKLARWVCEGWLNPFQEQHC